MYLELESKFSAYLRWTTLVPTVRPCNRADGISSLLTRERECVCVHTQRARRQNTTDIAAINFHATIIKMLLNEYHFDPTQAWPA